jgi:hypothetical protein
MSFRDIGAILNKEVQEREAQQRKEQQQNIDNHNENQQQHLSLSTQYRSLLYIFMNSIFSSFEIIEI